MTSVILPEVSLDFFCHFLTQPRKHNVFLVEDSVIAPIFSNYGSMDDTIAMLEISLQVLLTVSKMIYRSMLPLDLALLCWPIEFHISTILEVLRLPLTQHVQADL